MPHVDVKQSGRLALRDAKRVERAREFSRGRGAPVSLPEVFSEAGRRFQVAHKGRHYRGPDLECLDLDQVASGLRCDYKRNRGAGSAAAR
jgi:hypothetical protein